jgi:hypothetical protein
MALVMIASQLRHTLEAHLDSTLSDKEVEKDRLTEERNKEISTVFDRFYSLN